MAGAVTIAVYGLRELSRSLKKVDSEAAKQLRVVFNEAAELVISTARPTIPRRTGRAANSLKTRSTRTAVRVTFGGPRAPYYPWLDFGGRTGRKKRVVREFIQEGRYVFPAYYRRHDDIMAAMQDGIERVARNAGLEVS
jgi:hypothetical protein